MWSLGGPVHWEGVGPWRICQSALSDPLTWLHAQMLSLSKLQLRFWPLVTVKEIIKIQQLCKAKRKSFVHALCKDVAVSSGSGFVVIKQHGGNHRRPVLDHHWGPAIKMVFNQEGVPSRGCSIKRVFPDKGWNTCWLMGNQLMTSEGSSYIVLINM